MCSYEYGVLFKRFTKNKSNIIFVYVYEFAGLIPIKLLINT